MNTSTKEKKPDKFGVFVNGMLPYVRLQTKLAFTSDKVRTKPKIALRWILNCLIFAFILLFAWGFFKALVSQGNIVKPRHLAILLYTVGELVVLIYAIAAQCKRLFAPADLNTILIYPVSPLQRYAGEILTIFIKITVVSFIIFYPILLMFMGATGLLNAAPVWALTGLFSALLMPTLPFCISLLLVIPFIYISKLLKNKDVLKLILFIIFFLAILILYALMLYFMSDWYIHLKNNKEVLEGIENLLIKMNHYYNPAFSAKVIAIPIIDVDASYEIHNELIGYGFGVNTALCLLFAVIGMASTYQIYKSITRTDRNNESGGANRHIKYDGKGAYAATYAKEFKEIIRTSTYAYFFFGVAFCMPVLTFLIMDLIKKLGESKVGSQAFFGLAMLVIMIIISLIGSYSANIISREQRQLYISKITPIRPRKYLFTKMLVNFTVAFIGLVLCIVVLTATSLKRPDSKAATLDWKNILFLFAICLVFLIGISFNSINLNLARPKVELSGTPNESNIAIQLAIGIVVSCIVSIFAILSDAILGKNSIWSRIIILSTVLIYALINFLVFFFTADKKYHQIEVR